MEVYLNQLQLQVDVWHPVEDIRDLSYLWDHEDEYHTFIIYDIDAKQSPYIHQLVINIPGHQIRKGDIIFDYIPPNPPANDDNHRYLIIVYLQHSHINDIKDASRSRYPLRDLVAKNNLQFVDKVVLEVDPESYQFFLRSKKEDPLDPLYPLLMPGSNLTEGEKKYCSCVPKVATKQTDNCLREQAWGQEREGKICYSPYAICSSSTHHNSKQCGLNYNYDEMSKETKRKYYTLAGKI